MEKSHTQLAKENEELRDLCCFLDDGRQKTKQVAHEWQSFGRYTAAVLKNEVDGFETKLAVLQEKLQKLSQENAELRDLCLFLNQIGAAGNTAPGKKPATTAGQPQSAEHQRHYAAHSACVTEMNEAVGSVPCYGGITGEAKLTDEGGAQEQRVQEKKSDDYRKQQQKDKAEGTSSYVSQLETRLERLESEKLELVKSLSAAHMLTAGSDEKQQQQGSSSSFPMEGDLHSPPNVRAFLEYVSTGVLKATDKTQKEEREEKEKQREQPQHRLSTGDILKLVTLIDISQRLDAIPTHPPLQPLQEAEVAVLRALIYIVWQQLRSRGESGEEKRGEQHGKGSKPRHRLVLSTEL